MKILILASSYSGLCQRVLRELITAGHSVDQHYGMDEPKLRKQLANFKPELVVCPFLTHRIPTDIWQTHRCLIVHPGIEGDRGPSSLDWAISGSWDYWGVTLLQADAEMDAGDIWGTQEFALRAAGKTSTYKREVSSAAVKLILKAIDDAKDPSFSPRPLDYSDPRVAGTLQDPMRQPARKIDWHKDTTQTVMQKLRAADTSPGVLDEIRGQAVHLFGPIAEPSLRGEPGELLAIRYDAVCRATSDGAIWIRQLKCQTLEDVPAIKLPAARVLEAILSPAEMSQLQLSSCSETANDIRVEKKGSVAYIYFDFHNGAANTEQCVRLKSVIAETKQEPSIKTLVLMGGEDFFSNGIHLNCIEAAVSPADESWANINAIDDVVLEIINSPNHLTIAALRNNGGAGGAILALACDRVAIRSGVVLNPHYENMGLFGSEYWTYLLPKKVGAELAHTITQECQPMLASEAFDCGFADTLLSEDWDEYHDQLVELAARATEADDFEQAIELKREERSADEAEKPLAEYRELELKKMHATFYNPDAQYHNERREFVYKGKVPALQLKSAAVS